MTKPTPADVFAAINSAQAGVPVRPAPPIPEAALRRWRLDLRARHETPAATGARLARAALQKTLLRVLRQRVRALTRRR
jgi:hypothetical protein